MQSRREILSIATGGGSLTGCGSQPAAASQPSFVWRLRPPQAPGRWTLLGFGVLYLPAMLGAVAGWLLLPEETVELARIPWLVLYLSGLGLWTVLWWAWSRAAARARWVGSDAAGLTGPLNALAWRMRTIAWDEISFVYHRGREGRRSVMVGIDGRFPMQFSASEFVDADSVEQLHQVVLEQVARLPDARARLRRLPVAPSHALGFPMKPSNRTLLTSSTTSASIRTTESTFATGGSASVPTRATG